MKCTVFSAVVVESQPLMRVALSSSISDAAIKNIASFEFLPGVLESIQQLRPDIVLFSVGIPGAPELEAIARLRNMLPHITITAVLTGEMPGQRSEALQKGADLTLEKTQPKQEMLAAILQHQQRKYSFIENL